jgi:radical SAM protein with 4Fe4S-binding SPASM domain
MSANIPDLSSFTVNQIVSDSYHNALLQVYGGKYIRYRSLWDQAISGKIELDHPLHVDFELFNSCNYRCSFCPYSSPSSERPRGFDVKGTKELSLSLIEKVLIEAQGRLLAVELGYNTEPLLSQEILNIISLCKLYGVLDIRMSTNGSLLDKYDPSQLISSGLTQLQVSIDAVDDESYRLARQSSNYAKVVRNIHRVIKAREKSGSTLPRIRVTYVMTPQNKGSAQLFKNQWNGIADIIGLQDLMVYPETNLKVSTDGLVSVKDDSSYPGCYMPKVRLSIRSDGTVHPCCTVPGMSLRLGSIEDQSIEQLWRSPAMQKIRQSHFDGSWIKNKVCASCISNTMN